MTSGLRLEMVGLARLIGGFYGVRVCSEVFRSLSLFVPRALHSTEVNCVQVDSWRGCLARFLLGNDVFHRGVVQWTG
jgi:hypothetical protein